MALKGFMCEKKEKNIYHSQLQLQIMVFDIRSVNSFFFVFAIFSSVLLEDETEVYSLSTTIRGWTVIHYSPEMDSMAL